MKQIANELEEAHGSEARLPSQSPHCIVRRLGAAAELAFELGQFDLVLPMLNDMARLDPGPLERARATWIEEVVYTRPLRDATHVKALITAAERAGEVGARELQIDLIWLVAPRLVGRSASFGAPDADADAD